MINLKLPALILLGTTLLSTDVFAKESRYECPQVLNWKSHTVMGKIQWIGTPSESTHFSGSITIDTDTNPSSGVKQFQNNVMASDWSKRWYLACMYSNNDMPVGIALSREVGRYESCAANPDGKTFICD